MVVEDDDSIRLVLRVALEDVGYCVTEAVNAEVAGDLLRDTSPDLLLVDLRLPGLSGVEFIRRIRRSSTVPIIIVTAQCGADDIATGLEAGADDYITKPFVMRELVARVDALIRRAVRRGSSGTLACGPVQLHPDSLTVLCDGSVVPVSGLEFRVLSELMGARGRVLSRGYLLRVAWGYSSAGDGRVVDALIDRLRSRMEDDPDHPRMLLKVSGFGYRMTPPDDVQARSAG